LYLGGEKLEKSHRAFYYFSPMVVSGGVIRPVALFLIAFLCLWTIPLPPLSAQDQGPSGEAPVSGGGEAPGETGVFLETSPEDSILLGDDPPGLPPTAPGASVSLILRMLLILLLAAAAIYGVVYIFKRASRPAELRDPNVKLLSSVHLGANRFVHVVAVGTRVWLLGAGDGGVGLITEIEDQDAINALFLEESRRSARREGGKFPDFKAMLRRLGLPVDNSVPGADNIRKRRERLRGFK
jgi:flagellar protein FliO/FliZ